MNTLQTPVLAALLAVLVLGIAFFFLHDGGPGGGLVENAMTLNLQHRFPGCVVGKISWIRAARFVPSRHRDDPPGTAFYPIRVHATYTRRLPDGTTDGPTDATRTFYFYKDTAGRWAYEINSF
jgi:hypothetical protein